MIEPIITLEFEKKGIWDQLGKARSIKEITSLCLLYYKYDVAIDTLKNTKEV